MIKQDTIDELRQRMDIYDVISQHVNLKKSGTGYTGCCPFHNEKTPSFHVSPAKQIYKCFGCGAGGDAIRFIQEHKKMNFIEAVEYLCNTYNITIQKDQQAAQEAQEKKDKRSEMTALMDWAFTKYQQLLRTLPDESAAIAYLVSRGYSRERIAQWSLGYAPDEWKFITTPAINMGKHAVAVDCGLVVTKEGNSFDFFRNRIIIPIHDHNGIIVGFGGRWVPGLHPEADKQQPKYLNSPETLIYSKSRTWYGLCFAQKAIQTEGFAYVVEGYMDVQSMHDAGMNNTIASSGTEVNEKQVKLLKRYTDHVVICYDGDNPGQSKMMKQINLFLVHEFKVTVVELPGGMDPDEFIKQQSLTPADLTTGAFSD